MSMKIDYDDTKDAVNTQKHGVSLSEAGSVEWGTAVIWPDTRKNYGENRMVAMAYIGARIYSVVFVDRDNVRRIISLRKANKREVRRYAET